MNPTATPVTFRPTRRRSRNRAFAASTPRDVDLPGRRVTVRGAVVVINGVKVEQERTKTDASQGRRVPLLPELVPILTELVEGKAPSDRVFTTARGASVNRANYSRREFRAAAAIGMPGLRPHALQHTAVSLAIASGATVKEVQAIAGHADASVTLNVYGHLFEDSLDRVAARMAAFVDAERARPTQSPQARPA
ncbi:MAG: site-specific integrase [Cellulomonas sp.]|nr:site-specific integrase [Cellulomonas sp.]MCR6688101.1 site-specific integrase [Cellulomonas sp.]